MEGSETETQQPKESEKQRVIRELIETFEHC